MLRLTKNKVFWICIILIFLVAGVLLGFLGCSSDPDGVSYDDGSVIVDKNVSVYDPTSSDYKIVSINDSVVRVDNADSLHVGSVICAGISDTTPYGLMKKVNSVENKDGQYLLSTENASFTDVFKKCNISCTAILLEDGNYSVSYQNKGKNILSQIFPQAFADSEIGMSFPLFENPIFDVTAGAKINFDLKVFDGKVDTKLTTSIFNEVALKKDISNSASVQLSFPLYSKPIFIYEPVPIIINVSVDAALDSGEIVIEQGFIECGVHFEKELGFRYSSDNGFEAINEDKSYRIGPSLNITGDLVKIIFDPSISISLTAKLYDTFGFSLSAGIKDQVGVKLISVGNNTDYDSVFEYGDWKFIGKICHKITLPISGEVVIGIDKNPFDGSDDWELSYELFNTGDRITLYDSNDYYSYEQYKLQFSNDWKKAYANYLQKYLNTLSTQSSSAGSFSITLNYSKCCLFTLDDGETPMLYISPSSYWYGGRILAYNDDDQLKELTLPGEGGLQIIKNEGLLLWNSGHMGTYYDVVYSWNNDSFSKIFNGMYGDKQGYRGNPSRDDTSENQYYIDNVETSYNDYLSRLNDGFNLSKAENLDSSSMVTTTDMLNQLRSGN